MKFLKILAILLAVIVGLVLIVAYGIGKEDVHVERTMTIDADPAAVYYNLVHLPEWKNWSTWDQIDPNMKSTYSDPASGVGAYHEWTSDHDQVGNGKMTITEVEEGKLVRTKLEFVGQGTGYGDWLIEPVEGGTKVTATFDTQMKGPVARIMGLMMDKWIGPNFEEGIKALGEHAKTTNLDPAGWTMTDFSVKEMEPMTIYSITRTTDMSNLSDKMGEMFGALTGHVWKHNADITGKPLAIYHDWSEERNSTTMECGIPVKRAGKEEDEVKASQTPGGAMLTASFFGDYANLSNAHEKFHAYMEANNMESNGPPWEWYVTDPGENEDKSTWETRIYYPIASLN